MSITSSVYFCQDFVHSHLAELTNLHVLEDVAGITGQVVVELGRAETYVLRCSRNQAGKRRLAHYMYLVISAGYLNYLVHGYL